MPRNTKTTKQVSANGTHGRPRYEVRAHMAGRDELEITIWQLPSTSSPRLKEPERTATLKGRPLRLIESRVYRRLKAAGADVSRLKPGQSLRRELDEELALNLALMFRALAPMRSIDRIETVATGIDRMSREEASYWLGMAVHRSRPRRVLAALRLLLTTP